MIAATAPSHVVFRCDAGPEIGAGHLVRSIALAEGFLACGVPSTFVTGALVGAWRDMIEARGFPLIEDKGVGRASTGHEVMAQIAPKAKALVVLDGYGFFAEHVREARRVADRVAVIRDHGTPAGADVVIDHNLSAEPYAEANPAALQLLGPRYALLRNEFHRARRLPIPSDRPEILICLGGSQATPVLLKVLDALSRISIPFVARVIASPHDAQTTGESEELGPGILHWLSPQSTLAHWFSRSHLAVLAAGGARFEAACCGCPMILGILADNQVRDAEAFADRGIARLVGWWDDAPVLEIARVIEELLRHETIRHSLSQQGRALIDGRGAIRTARSIIEHFAFGMGPTRLENSQ